ncbi:MAG: fused response regulator/phosphatase, partial [Planctomycetes bacterium]|nr:fused response regulator/phosphatase [Planctomycetota bacterium]
PGGSGGGGGLPDGAFAGLVEKLGLVEVSGVPGEAGYQAATQNVERLGEALVARSMSAKELKENFLRAIFNLSPEQQERLFGSRFDDESAVAMDKMLLNLSLKSRAEIARREIESRGVAVDEMREMIRGLVAHESEIVDLAELITMEVDLGGRSFEERTEFIQKLQRMVEAGVFLEGDGEAGPAEGKARGTAVVADADEETVAIFRKALVQGGFRVVPATDGATLVESLRAEPPDLLVMELKLPRLHGLDVLALIKRDRTLRARGFPIVFATEHAAFEKDFEVQTYSKYRFLTKPVRPQQLMASVDELLPVEKEEEIDPFKEDLQKARKIQAKLLPDTIPEVPGFDVGTFYSSCLEVGGDYFDVIPIDESHTGLMVADVSGKGVSGAMVMVMVRSILRMIAPQTTSARETVVNLNRLIADSMKLGMFVTAIYMVLDHVRGVVNISCAGHNPAVVFREGEGCSKMMNPSGMALGIINGPIFENAIKEVEVPLAAGDRVLTYTDGVVEAMSVDNAEYGDEALIAVVDGHARDVSKALIEKVLEDVHRHEGGAPRHDDITVVTFRRLP